MRIGGLLKTSLIDYPGKIAAVIFTQGCNFRCFYCHNPELIAQKDGVYSEKEILDFLGRRRRKISGVVITGGEPTLQEDLPSFLKKIKEMGFLIKLDTNGSNPRMLEELIEQDLVDYIAMDIKGPFGKYRDIACADVNINDIKESIRLLMNSNLDYEFRTTIGRGILDMDDIEEIAKYIEGARLYALQRFKFTKALNPKRAKNIREFTDDELQMIKKRAEYYVQRCIIR